MGPSLSVTLFLGTGGQFCCDEFLHTELSMRVKGTRTSLDGAIDIAALFSGRRIDIPGHCFVNPGHCGITFRS